MVMELNSFLYVWVISVIISSLFFTSELFAAFEMLKVEKLLGLVHGLCGFYIIAKVFSKLFVLVFFLA